jgi:hypothetical protein
MLESPTLTFSQLDAIIPPSKAFEQQLRKLEITHAVILNEVKDLLLLGNYPAT